MDRRAFLGALTGSLLAAPLAAAAQQAGKVYRIGVLLPTAIPFVMTAFVDGLRERGWIEGRDFVLETRLTGFVTDQADVAARELVASKVDVILAGVTGNAVAAKRATTQIPIVMLTSGYPVEAGLAQSFARPGGNITGNTNTPELGCSPSMPRSLKRSCPT